MKIVVSGGGTGGHIYPALAFINSVKKHQKNLEVLYIGTENGLESKIVPNENIPFKTIDISGFKRKLSLENVKTVAKFLHAVKTSKNILKEFQPDIVIGTGGYVCGPVVYAAHRLNIPAVIHEQNSVPGLTNKFLSKYVEKVAISFWESADYFPEGKVVFTGNPRASEVSGFDGRKGKTDFGLDPDKKTVLIFGGSRGARPINECVVEMLPKLAERPYQVLYATGDIHYKKVVEEAKAAGNPENVKIVPFIQNMPEVLSGMDLVVSRAGATSIAEITSIGLPSILIPSPYVTNNHQEKNAGSLRKNGASIMILEKELTAEKLLSEMDRIIGSDQLLDQMKKSAKSLGVPDAAERLYDVCKDIVH